MFFEDKKYKSFCNCLSITEKKKSFDFSYYQNSSLLKASVKDGLTYFSLQRENINREYLPSQAHRCVCVCWFCTRAWTVSHSETISVALYGGMKVQCNDRLRYCQHCCLLMWLNGFLAHVSVQQDISNNHEEMLTNSLISVTNAVEHGIAVLYFHILSCVLFIWERDCGVSMWFQGLSSWINDKSGTWNCWI